MANIDMSARDAKDISNISLTIAVRSTRTKGKQHHSNSVLPASYVDGRFKNVSDVYLTSPNV